MPSHPLYATVGASGGLSLAALFEWLQRPTTMGAFAFVGSIASTLIGWGLARRAEIVRANLELERERREMERESRLLDVLAQRAAVIDISNLPKWEPRLAVDPEDLSAGDDDSDGAA